MNRKVAGLIAAAVLALVGIGLVVTSLGGGDDTESETQAAAAEAAGVQTRSVLVVSETIPAGTSVEEIAELAGSLRVEDRPVDQVPADTLGGIPDLLAFDGFVTVNDLNPDELVQSGRLLSTELYSAAAAPIEVPDGLLQATFSLESNRIVGGNIRAGDHVAVISTITVEGQSVTTTPLHQVLVTNIFNEVPITTEGTSNNQLVPAVTPGGRWIITVALDGADMEKLVFLLEGENFKLWLASEPASADLERTGFQDLTDVLGVDDLAEVFELTEEEEATSPAPDDPAAG